MSRKNRLFVGLVVSMNVLYLVFLFGMKVFGKQDNEAPVISFNKDIVSVKVDADDKDILKGVYASDQEDGDISDKVFIYDISGFDEEKQRTVTYAVFDSQNQMSTASRKIVYKDYIAPQFYSDEPLINLSLKSSSDSSYMKAKSCVDGDISNKVSVSKVEDNNKVVYKYNVTDSTGTSSSLEISDEISLKGLYTNIDIQLSDYIIYVKKGSTLRYRNYIESVNTSLGEQNELIPYIDIESNFDGNVEGQYEVKYTLNRSNGDYGLSKMIVIVE